MSVFDIIGNKMNNIISVRDYLEILAEMYKDVLDTTVFNMDHLSKQFTGYIDEGEVILANDNDTKAEKFTCLYASIILHGDLEDKINPMA